MEVVRDAEHELPPLVAEGEEGGWGGREGEGIDWKKGGKVRNREGRE